MTYKRLLYLQTYMVIGEDEWESWYDQSASWCNFTGTVVRKDSVIYLKKGQLYRELGPAVVWRDSSSRPDEYWLSDSRWYNGEEKIAQYWQIMWEKFKGTEYERLCMSKILGANE
jgi:hypothetical protein